MTSLKTIYLPVLLPTETPIDLKEVDEALVVEIAIATTITMELSRKEVHIRSAVQMATVADQPTAPEALRLEATTPIEPLK